MLRIGVTGHTDLSPAAEIQVRDRMRASIARLAGGDGFEQVRGVTCLAPGADMIFAQVMLELGAAVEAVVPSTDYRQTLPPECVGKFDSLLDRASKIDYMSDSGSGVRAFRCANAELLRRSDHLIAVWNRAVPANPGGTSEVVNAAQAAGIPIDVIWPT